MNDPFEDSWGDLAAEFGIDAPKPKPVQPEPVPVSTVEDFSGIEPAPVELTSALFAEVPLQDAADDSTDAEVMEGAADAETAADGETAEDGEKKRRRRRRRRKKGDGPETASEGSSPDIDTPTTAAEDALAQPSDMLRDIIANWDVPSWDDIVAGLHRPNR